MDIVAAGAVVAQAVDEWVGPVAARLAVAHTRGRYVTGERLVVQL
jgi:hypothetical protein